MAFNVKPIVPAAKPAEGQSSSAQTARERAISMLAGGQASQVGEIPGEVITAAAKSSEEAGQEAGATDVVEGQANTVEDSSKESLVKEEAKAEEPLSTQYAILARKEKALRAKVTAQETELKTKEAAILAREEALKAKEAEYQSGYISKTKLSESPWEVLNEAGLTYDQLTELALNTPQQDPATKAAIARLEAQVKAQEEAAKRASKAYEDQQKTQYDQAVNQIRAEVKSTVFTNAEFETIKETGSYNDVVDLIEQTFKQDGVLLSVDEACKEVEEYLMEEAMKIARISKIQKRLSPPVKTEAPKQTQEQPKQLQMKTLTNAVSGSKQLTKRERAILAFKGELK